MRLIDATKPMFARHETFHPRYGWFRKAFTFVSGDPRIFLQDDATVQIGVGKNMVRAIRFWGLAAKLIAEDPNSSRPRSPDLTTTDLGKELFGKNGWDRYMEDPGTLWLLHWLLLAPRSRLPVWWLAFNEFHAVEFNEEDLKAVVTTQLHAVDGWAKPHPTSIKKDISALLRTYAPAERSGRTGIDDILDCPLRELNLIGRSVATGRYRFTLGAKATLPPAILTYVILDYVERINTRENTITINRLAHEPGSPGKVFKLAEAEMLSALEPVVDETDMLAVAVVTGAPQLYWSGEPREIASEILDKYYECSGGTSRPSRNGDQLKAAALVGACQ